MPRGGDGDDERQALRAAESSWEVRVRRLKLANQERPPLLAKQQEHLRGDTACSEDRTEKQSHGGNTQTPAARPDNCAPQKEAIETGREPDAAVPHAEEKISSLEDKPRIKFVRGGFQLEKVVAHARDVLHTIHCSEANSSSCRDGGTANFALLDGSCYAKNGDLAALIRTAKMCSEEQARLHPNKQESSPSQASEASSQSSSQDSLLDHGGQQILERLQVNIQALRSLRDFLDPSIARVVSELLRCVEHVVFWDEDKSFAAMIAEQERESAVLGKEHSVWNERLNDIEDKVATMKTVLLKATGERKAWQANLFALSEERKDTENEEGNLLEELQQRRTKTRAMILELDNLEYRLASSKADLEVEIQEEKVLNEKINSISQAHQNLKKYYQELHGTESGYIETRIPDGVHNRAMLELEVLQERLERFTHLEKTFAQGMDLKKIRLTQVKEDLEAAKRVRLAFDAKIPVRERPENRALTPRPDWPTILRDFLPCLNKNLRNHPAYVNKVGGIADKEAQAVKKAADAFRRGRRRRPMRLKRSNSIDSEPFTFAASRKMIELLQSIRDAPGKTNANHDAPGGMLAMLQNQIENVRANLVSTKTALLEAEKCIPSASEYFGGDSTHLEGRDSGTAGNFASMRVRHMAKRSSVSGGDSSARPSARRRSSVGSESEQTRASNINMADVLASLRSEQVSRVSEADQVSGPGRRKTSKYSNMSISSRKSSQGEAKYSELAQRARKAIARRRDEGSAAPGAKSAIAESVLKLIQDEKRRMGSPTKAENSEKPVIAPFHTKQLLEKPLTVTLVSDVPTFVVCLGQDPKVPRFLRATGKVQYRQIKPDELSSLIDDLFDERSGNLQLQDKPLEDLLYNVLRRRFGAQNTSSEWAYNLVREIYDLQEKWAIARIFLLVLAGEVGDPFLSLENDILLELHTFFKRVDLETQKEVSGSAKPVDLVYVTDVIESLHDFAPRARPSEQRHWAECLRQDLQGRDQCTYTRTLFADPRKSTFIQALMLHVVNHLYQHMKALVSGFKSLEKVAKFPRANADGDSDDVPENASKRRRSSAARKKPAPVERVVTLQTIKAAIVKVDPGLDDDDISKLVARTHGCKPTKINWDREVNPTLFAKRFCQAVIPYPSRPIFDAEAPITVTASTSQEAASLAATRRRTHTLIRKSTSKRASFLDIQTSLASTASLGAKTELTSQGNMQPKRPSRLKTGRSARFGKSDRPGKSGRSKLALRTADSFSFSLFDSPQLGNVTEKSDANVMETLTESMYHEDNLPTLTESIVSRQGGDAKSDSESDDI